MTKDEANRVLGLTGGEDGARVRAVYEAQAAALDARIGAAQGADLERYRRDRDEVELARLALLGSEVRAAASQRTSTSLGEVLLLLVGGPGLYFGLIAGYAWTHVPDHVDPARYTLTAALMALGWIVGGCLHVALVYGVGRLFRGDWTGFGAVSYFVLSYVALSYLDEPIAVATARLAMGGVFAWALVAGLVAAAVGTLQRKEPP